MDADDLAKTHEDNVGPVETLRAADHIENQGEKNEQTNKAPTCQGTPSYPEQSANIVDTGGIQKTRVACATCGNVKVGSTEDLAKFILHCRGCQKNYCRAVPCAYPDQGTCARCSPGILDLLCLRLSSTGWWNHTRGEHGLSNSTQYRKRLSKNLQAAIFPQFEKGKCVNDSLVGDDIMFWPEAINTSTLGEMQKNLEDLRETKFACSLVGRGPTSTRYIRSE